MIGNKKKILFVQSNSREGGITCVHKKLAFYFKNDGYAVSFLTFVRNPETDDYVHCLGLKKLSLLSYIKSFLLVGRFLKSEKPDIVIAGSELMSATVSFWKKKYGYFLLINQHIDIESFMKTCSVPKKLLYDFAKRINRRADIIANCSRAAAETTNRYYNIKNCVALYNPVEPFEAIPASYPHSVFEKNKVIVACGNLNVRKNYPLMLKGFALARKDSSDPLKLVILGLDTEHQLQSLVDLASELCIKDDIVFCGGVKNPRDYMYFSEFLLHTSLFEGLPLVFVEALSTGIPVVTTDFKPGSSELLGEHKEYGRLISDYTPESVAESILIQLAAPKKERAFYQQAVKKFMPEEAYKAYKNLIEVHIHQ